MDFVSNLEQGVPDFESEDRGARDILGNLIGF
jgi:hypothetical protein